MAVHDGGAGPGDGSTSIRLGARRWAVSPGAELTFGRGHDRDVRFGHDPVDDYVSRSAGTLVGLADGLLVRNDSATQALQLIAMPGPDLRIAPGGAVATMPHPVLRLVVPGRFGRRYALGIDTRALRPRAVGAGVLALPVQDGGGLRTRGGASRITPREMRMLVVLCEPLLTLAGDTPATYRQIAAALDTTPQTVRTCLDGLRARLSDLDGIPGLRLDEDGDGPATASYLAALAHWAVDTGQVVLADVHAGAAR